MIKIINVIYVISLIITIFVISFLDPIISERGKNKVILIFTIIISLFLASRSIGLDLEGYREIFDRLNIFSITEIFSKDILSSQLEPLFVIMISFLKRYGLGFNWFLLISGGIPMFIIYKIIKATEEKYVIITLLLFLLINFFRGPIDIIRHFFAATLYLSAIYLLSQGKRLRFWLTSLFSITVHYSNLVILPIRPLLKISWSKTKYIISIMIVCIIGFTSKIVIAKLNLSQYSNITNPVIGKLIYYLTYYNKGGYIYLGLLHKILLYIISYFPILFNIIFNFITLNKINLIKKDYFYKLLLNSQIIGSLIAIIFIILNASTLGIRLNFLLSIGSFLLIKEIIFNYYSEHKKELYVMVILSLVFYNFMIVLYFAGVHDPMSPFFLF